MLMHHKEGVGLGKEAEQGQFWKELDQEVNAVPRNEKIIVGGDLNGEGT